MDINKLDPKDWVFKSQRQRVSPFPNYFSMETSCNDMKSKVGFNVDKVLYFIKNNVHYLFLSVHGYKQIGQGLTDNIYKDAKLVGKLIKQQDKHGKRLSEFSKKANKKVKNKISNQELFNLFVDYEKFYKEVYSRYGWIWVFEDFYIESLLKIVESRPSVKNNIQASKILNVLTKELTAMVATVENKSLLELSLQVVKDFEWKELILSKDENKIKANKKLDKLIDRHVREFFWLTRDYEDPILDFSAVVTKLEKVIQSNPEEEYRKLVTRLENTEKSRSQYLQELNLEKQELAAINSMRQVAYLKELRKRYVSESLYYFDDVLKEIGKRTFLSINQVRHLKTEDVKKVLLGGEDLSHELNERIKLSLWLVEEGTDTQILTGKVAEDMFTKFCAVDENATEFTGMAVSPGVIQGPIKIIINPDECDRVEKGDIILSIQVVPSFSTAIMKAGGLICDGGHGITTHPATLAREAGIPGVIQTRFARNVLKDGDMVEVDGNKGIVRKL